MMERTGSVEEHGELTCTRGSGLPFSHPALLSYSIPLFLFQPRGWRGEAAKVWVDRGGPLCQFAA